MRQHFMTEKVSLVCQPATYPVVKIRIPQLSVAVKRNDRILQQTKDKGPETLHPQHAVLRIPIGKEHAFSTEIRTYATTGYHLRAEAHPEIAFSQMDSLVSQQDVGLPLFTQEENHEVHPAHRFGIIYIIDVRENDNPVFILSVSRIERLLCIAETDILYFSP